MCRVAKADEAVARAELELLSRRRDKKADAEKKLTAANGSLDKARQGARHPGEQLYTRLPGRSRRSNRIWKAKTLAASHFPRRAPAAARHWPSGSPIARIRSRPASRSITSGRDTSASRSCRRCSTSAAREHAPTHPELLDWLAVEFMEQDWSMKHLHRLIVTSNTYRLSASAAQRIGRHTRHRSRQSLLLAA